MNYRTAFVTLALILNKAENFVQNYTFKRDMNLWGYFYKLKTNYSLFISLKIIMAQSGQHN